MARCFIGMGANQGNVRETFKRVLEALDLLNGISVERASSTYLSQSMGQDAEEDFLNAVVEIQTTLPPIEVLAELQAIETEFGRVRTTTWGPRTIDLDLLYFDDERLTGAVLTLPHPHVWYRRFALLPMCEIAADFVHPRFLLTQRELLQRIERNPFKLLWSRHDRLPENVELLMQEFPPLVVLTNSTPDETTALIVGDNAARDTILPVLDLQTIPAINHEEALRNVIEACLGRCELVN